ncbi:hypothetical protein B0H13DRAFT_2306294 [Mycena leptocephala]|nr:hypothetical protein B0H13DRAFT_2306294 [Mycena leptocephala]
MPIPSTDNEVTELYMRVRRCEPKYPGFAYGYVYATRSSKRRVVAVPYNYGVTKLASVNDLYVHAWVPNCSRASHIVDMGEGHLLVSTLPGSIVPLEFSYSLFYVPRGRAEHLVDNKCGAIRSDTPWNGNILVVKHGKRKPVINMEREDAFLVDSIVSACIDNGLLV